MFFSALSPSAKTGRATHPDSINWQNVTMQDWLRLRSLHRGDYGFKPRSGNQEKKKI